MRKMKWSAVLAAVVLLILCLAGCGGKEVPKLSDLKADPDAYADKANGFQLEKPAAGEEVAVMHTSMGDISIRFFPEAAPKAVANFKALAKNGYYDGLTFHRVMNDFMIQGGDPNGDGTGGESVWDKAFSDEFSKKLMNLRGSLAMANSGVDTNGSQFFINQAGPTGDTAAELKASVETSNKQAREQVHEAYEQYADYYGASFTDMYPTEEAFLNANLTPAADLVPEEVWELYAENGGNMHLDGGFRYEGGHTVFGQVYEGMDVVDAIAAVKTDGNDKPTSAVTIESIDIITYGE